jgi:hypothetical protein
MSGALPTLGARERQLLLGCARLELDDALVQRTRGLLRSGLDWDRAVVFAEAHSVAPLLHRQLQRLDVWAEVPAPARQRLLQLAHRTEYRNRLYSAGLSELLELFAGAGVPVIVLKGLSLVELIYGDFSLRPLIDLNLLIPRTHLTAARTLLLRHGYTETVSRGSPFYRWSHSQLVIEKPGAFRLFLMLQWDLLSWPRMHAIDLPRFWQDSQAVRLSGRDARIPSPIDFVLYLCLQADKYAFLNALAVDRRDPAEFVFDESTYNRLIRFTDLNEVIRHYQGRIDWSELAERARAGGIEESVHVSLRCVERLFRPAIPPAVLVALRSTPHRRLRHLASRAVLESESREPHGRLEARLMSWWRRQSTPVQRQWIKRLDLIEFVFPRRDVVRRRHQSAWGRSAALAYPFHVCGALLRCALHLPGWTYGRLRGRLSRRPRLAPPASGRPPLPHRGLGPV